jgi:hypothetical protein
MICILIAVPVFLPTENRLFMHPYGYRERAAQAQSYTQLIEMVQMNVGSRLLKNLISTHTGQPIIPLIGSSLESLGKDI